MKNNSSRRRFLINAGKTGLASLVAAPVLSSFKSVSEAGTDSNYIKDDINYLQQPLKYAYNALEPLIDAQTMELHYSKHAAGYTKNLSDAAKDEHVDTAATSIVQLLGGISKYSAKMRNNAGGHYNHEMFWRSMQAPGGATNPPKKLNDLIVRDFNSLEAFKTQFGDAAKNRFGSGWAWLVYTNDKKLVISSTANQDNPLMDLAEVKGYPLLGLDVWEHAYYLKYQNRRADYITAWWGLVNWNYVESRMA